MGIKSILLVAIFVLAGEGLAAQAAPGVALRDRQNDNLITLDVTGVQVPNSLPGFCRVTGVIRTVDGDAFLVGQRLSLSVPCGGLAPASSPGLQLPTPRFSSDVSLIDPAILTKSKRGEARIDDQGKLIWRPKSQVFRLQQGVTVVGYQVLDGALLPVSPN